MVPVGEGAGCRVGREIRAQPAPLPRARPTATDLFAVGVEDDDMPGAEIVAVVPLAAVAGRLPK